MTGLMHTNVACSMLLLAAPYLPMLQLPLVGVLEEACYFKTTTHNTWMPIGVFAIGGVAKRLKPPGEKELQLHGNVRKPPLPLVRALPYMVSSHQSVILHSAA